MIRTIFILAFLLMLPSSSFAQRNEYWQAGRGYDSTYEVNVPAVGEWKQKYVYHGNGDTLAVFDAANCIVRYYQHYPDDVFIKRCPHHIRYQMHEDGFEMQEIDKGEASGAYHFLSANLESKGQVKNNFPAGFWSYHNRKNGTSQYLIYYNQTYYSIGYLSILLIGLACLIFAGIKLSRAGQYPQFYISICIVFLILLLVRMGTGITESNLDNDTERSFTGDLILALRDFAALLFYLVFILAIVNLFRTKKYPSLKVLSIIVAALTPALQFLYFVIVLISSFHKIGG